MPLISPPAIPEEQVPWGRIRLIYKRIPTWEALVNIFEDYSSVQKAMISEQKIERSSWGNIFMKNAIYHRYWQWTISGGVVDPKTSWAIMSMADHQRYDLQYGQEWRILLEDTIYPDSFYQDSLPYLVADPAYRRTPASFSLSKTPGSNWEPGTPIDPSNPGGAVHDGAKYAVYNVALSDISVSKFASLKYVGINFTATELEILNET